MFKWKITNRKAAKQSKLNNELAPSSSHLQSSSCLSQILPDKRNWSISDMLNVHSSPGSHHIDTSASHPLQHIHHIPQHQHQQQQVQQHRLPPHATYPNHAHSICPIYASVRARQPLQKAAPTTQQPPNCPPFQPPPYVPPPTRPHKSQTIPSTSTLSSHVQQSGSASVSSISTESPVHIPTFQAPVVTATVESSSLVVKAPEMTSADNSEQTTVDPITTIGSSTTADSACADGAGSSSSWMEWTQQLQAYIAWVNSQLRKRQLKLVHDLRKDLCSGVVLAKLIEILSGERIAGIHGAPETPQLMRENVQRILQFMAAKRMRMHVVNSKDIVEGNLKSIMRLILALAAHYKPESVRTSSYCGDSSSLTVEGCAGLSSTKSTTTSTTTTTTVISPGDLVDPEKQKISSSRNSAVGKKCISLTSCEQAGRSAERGALVSDRIRESTSNVLATPNLNVPGNRKSIGHLFEPSVASASPLRRFPSISGHQWAGHQWSVAVNGTIEGESISSADTRLCDDELTSRRAMRKQWSVPGPPLYENLHRSSSFAAAPRTDADERSTRLSLSRQHHLSTQHQTEEQCQRRQQQHGISQRSGERQTNGGQEAIYDVPRLRPSTASSNVESCSSMSSGEPPAVSVSAESVGNSRDAVPTSSHQPMCAQTTQTDQQDGVATTVTSPGNRHRPLIDGYSSLPRNGVKPAALRFWQSLASHTTEDDSGETLKNEFRHNGGLRTSGRRLLPKIPTVRSKGIIIHQTDDSAAGKDVTMTSHCDPVVTSSVPRRLVISDDIEEHSLGSRGEVEGSSSHGSPTTSIVRSREDVVSEWLRGGGQRRSHQWKHQSGAVTAAAGDGLESGTNLAHVDTGRCQLWRNSAVRRSTQLEHWGRGIELRPPHEQNGHRHLAATNLPAKTAAGKDTTMTNEDLIEELNRARRQLIVLQQLLSNSPVASHREQKHVSNVNKPQTTHTKHINTTISQEKEEVLILRHALQSLRHSLNECDHSQHTLDTIEQCVSVILQRLAAYENGHQVEEMAPQSPSKRAPISALHGQNSFTKVVYYTEKTVTPYLSSINKQLGEITLRDFKAVFDRTGSYRFHFKSVDPEFGMVKEEVLDDDEILPGFDGKVIAWVIDDS